VDEEHQGHAHPRAGCVVQVTTQQRNPDGSYAVAEALTFVPGVHIKEVKKGKVVIGRELVFGQA